MTQPLLVVIPLAAAEIPLASSLFTHLSTQGTIPFHAVLFVADRSLSDTAYQPIIEAAKPIFPAGGSLIRTPLSLTPSYPHAHNHRFETALSHVASKIKSPFLYLSPHCVPMRKGWLLELEAEYGAHVKTKPIMGQLLTPESHGTAQPLIASTAIFPHDLPKRVMQRLISQRGVDFEKSCADLFVPIAHPSKLIWNHPLNGTKDHPKPPSIASLVHTARSREFSASLRGETAPPAPVQERSLVPIVAPSKVIPAPSSTKGRRVQAPVAEPSSTAYYHSGDLGDIIYALAAIRLVGGGKLFLGPKSLRTPPPANPMREDQFERFLPLLKAQPYLSKAAFSERHPGTDTAFDLNRFREQWGDKDLRAKTGISTLVRMHCHILGVDEKFHPGEPWLTVPSPIETGMFACHRSSRYHHDGGSPDGSLARIPAPIFPWEDVIKRFKGRLLFVGLASEHAAFQKEWDVRLPFWQCADFLDMARVIAGALGFIGNQSFPNAIALGCGQKVLQESWPVSPDCVLARPNFLTQPFNGSNLDQWEGVKSLEPIRGMGFTLIAVEKVTDHQIKVEDIPQHRLVSTSPINGVIELGPQEKAQGLGDTLTVTPLAAALGKRAVMCLPKSLERFAPLFDGLCPTRITEDFPVFPNPGNDRFIESKLKMFNIPHSWPGGQTPPIVKPTNIELAHAAKWEKAIRSEKPILIFQTECSKEWAHIRSRPSEWWKPIKEELSKHFQIVEGDSKLALRVVAARYKRIGLYFGVNTGNWHLAMAVGCKCLVVDADECEGYNPALWRYSLPSCEYVGFDVANVIAKIPWLLSQ